MYKKVDKIFLISFFSLLICGLTVFISASLGIYSKNNAQFTSIVFSQLFLGVFMGAIACFVAYKIPYKFWQKYSFWIFILSVISALLVFIPGVGICHGGACRWVNVFGFSFQPLEFLKIGFIIYLAAWIAHAKDGVQTFKLGLIPLIILLGIIGAILLKQPDTDSFIIIFIVGMAMYIIGGGKWRHMFLIIIIGLIGLSALFFSRPYLLARLNTFINPSENALTSGYQFQQSMIAVGSGEIFGRGLGQSVQKFKFLPESIGDAIFPVAAEELGFVGGVFIIFLYIFFLSRGLKVASLAPDVFSRLLVIGIVILITIQSFINIAAMIGVLPLSGSPLIFFSQGGTALFFTLAEIGIIINVSKYKKLV